MGNIKNTTSISKLSTGEFKKCGAFILLCLLSGCALFPPPPAQCIGQFKPVNAPIQKDIAPNKPAAVNSNTVNITGGSDNTLHREEGAVNGK